MADGEGADGAGDKKEDISDIRMSGKMSPASCLSHCNAPDFNELARAVPNAIVTSKYTLLTAIPKNLYMQFSRLANVYFLLISFLQLLPANLSPTNKWATAGPFSVILALNFLREVYEDSKRHKADAEVNGRLVEVVGAGGVMEMVKWKDVKLGDIVRVHCNSEFPADLVLLSSSLDAGMCYIDTCNLDGETNLKIRNALAATAALNDPHKVSTLVGTFHFEPPNSRLYTFSGKLVQPGVGESPVDINNILLRGSTLRNTKWVLGHVIYTGAQTKIMMNAKAGREKRSNVEGMVNKLLIGILCFELIVVTCCTFSMSLWVAFNGKAWYIPYVGVHTAGDTVLGWFTFLILLNNYVPISLYISLEIAKSVQGLQIDWDLAMYDETTDTPALTRTTNLNEELGQIRFIFSDKTGTLTQNVMEFRKCYINGTSYGFGTTEIGEAAVKRGATIERKMPEDIEAESVADPNLAQFHRDLRLDFGDARLLRKYREGHPDATQIRDFFRVLSVSHTVVPEGEDENPHTVVYQAESPDEGALTAFARAMGWFFCRKTSKVSTVDVHGKKEDYEILNVNKFNSARKRMSCVCRTPEGKIMLYCKGADNVMLARLHPEQKGTADLSRRLSEYATEGLRTLVVAQRELREQEWREWNEVHVAATTALDDREGALERAAEMVEISLELIGATAIEDKLQVGVPDTIEVLAEAGLKIWVLTGDKLETAVNIGFACRLLTDNMVQCYVNGGNAAEVSAQVARHLETYRAGLDDESSNLALIVDGHALLAVFADTEVSQLLLTFARMCKAVIACRVSPDQKRQIVQLVRHGIKPEPLTLAIGDGANDVPMIMEAHVGVGVSGNEGMQAVRSSDYAIAQFRFLKRLLLWHGRNSYRRVSVLIQFSLYKQMVMVTSLFLYNFCNGWSGTAVYDSWILTGFNTFYTFLPPIVYGFMEQDVSPEAVIKYPQLYEPGRQGDNFNAVTMLLWMINGILHCLLAFLLPLTAYRAFGSVDLGVFGTCIMNVLAIGCNIRIFFAQNHISKLSHAAISVSTLSFYIWAAILASAWGHSHSFDSFYSDVAGASFKDPVLWLSVLVTFVCMAVVDVSALYAHRTLRPSPTYIVQEMERGFRPSRALVRDENPPRDAPAVSAEFAPLVA